MDEARASGPRKAAIPLLAEAGVIAERHGLSRLVRSGSELGVPYTALVARQRPSTG